jgi:hypothetical protein
MERQLVNAKVPPDVVAEADKIAAELGTTRSKLIAWAIERTVGDLADRMAAAEDAGLALPPGIPWKARP